MKGSPCSIKMLLCYDGEIIGSYRTLPELYKNNSEIFRNLNQLRNWAVGRCLNQVNRRYSIIKL